MKIKCSFCGEIFDENELTVAMLGSGMLCGVCYQIDFSENCKDLN